MTARVGVRGERVRAERVRRLLAEAGFTGAGVRAWRERAACTGQDPELFYPLDPEQTQAAKRVCAGCPVRALCLTESMASEDPALRWGVTGGLSAGERGELFARRRRAVA